MARVPDTSMGGPAFGFPTTRWSTIVAGGDPTGEPAKAALATLFQLYWKPVYAYIRLHNPVPSEDPKDLTQQFLMTLMDGTLLRSYQPQRGAFRTYLRGAIKFFLMERRNEASALKRGGGRKVFSLDEGESQKLDSVVGSFTDSPDRLFDQLWAKSVLEDAIAELGRELSQSGKEVWLRAFLRYERDADPDESISYAQVGQELGVSERDVGNYLTYCRRRLRDLVVDRVADTVDHPKEIPAELSHILERLKDRSV